jgi:hypothetical protein
LNYRMMTPFPLFHQIGDATVNGQEELSGGTDMKVQIDEARVRMARRLSILAVAGWFAAACIAGALGIVNEPGRPPLVLAGFLALPILGFHSWGQS